jgi:hypothetical protein
MRCFASIYTANDTAIRSRLEITPTLSRKNATMLKTLFALAFTTVSVAISVASDEAVVNTHRVPNEGIQPQLAVGRDGVVHLIYFKGDAEAGDIFYVTSRDSAKSFSKSVRVNSQPGSAIAVGTVRGAQIALGKNDRVHVAWNGSAIAEPKGLPNPQLPEDSPYRLSSPMLYTHINSNGTSFEPQRNLMTSTYALDGGGSVAADNAGNVYVVWHGNSTNGTAGEGGRAVWVAKSKDEGRTFADEVRANREDTGACACCGLRAIADRSGDVYIAYRSAMDIVHRDMYVLVSGNRGQTFASSQVDPWEASRCVMSTAALHATPEGMLAAWETLEKVKFGPVDGLSRNRFALIVAPDSDRQVQKHPVLSTNSRGQVILVWTEGTDWQRGGEVAWQVFDASGQPIADAAGRAAGVPAWGLVAVFAGEDGEFTVIY